MRECILLVEDDPAGRELAQFNLEQAGYTVEAVDSGESALGVLAAGRYSLVITDLRMPGMDGIELMRRVKQQDDSIPVLVITAYGSVDVAVEAMRQGAYDFIGKPFNRDHLLLTVRRALEGQRLRTEVQRLRRGITTGERPIIASSEAMQRVLSVADRVADSTATVLITGETGTGKELVARRIHARSPRSSKPLVTINCAAVPHALLEAELFGHDRGAFTGATRARPGRFRQAQGGSLFLDEVGELPLSLQGKLLRVLEEHVVDILGRDTPESVDVRVIAATNRDLGELAREGLFRQDLMYRLNVIEIRVPPLRERREDIEPLIRHFVSRFAEGRDLAVPRALVETLGAHHWPGNVRQLHNACKRMVLLCQGDTLSLDDLEPLPRSEPPDAETTMPPSEWPPLPEGGLSLVDLEKQVIERVLAMKKGNVSQAAAYLSVPRHVLAYRMVKYGISKRR